MKTIVEQTIKHYPSPMEIHLLKERVKSSAYSLGQIAKEMNITYVTLWRKLNNAAGYYLTELELQFLLTNRWITIETEEKMSKL